MAIPKTLHFIWLGSPMPLRLMPNLVAWHKLNPDWKYQLWTNPIPGMYNEDLYWDAPLHVKSDAVWQMRADMMRYEILYREGGFYVDVDTLPLRPIGDLFDGLTEFAVREDENFVGNTYLASEPGNLVLHELMVEQLTHLQSFEKPAKLAAGVATGPQYMTDYWLAHNCHVDERTELWFPYNWEDVRRGRDRSVEIPADAYAVHSWNHSREKIRQYAKTTRQNKKLDKQ